MNSLLVLCVGMMGAANPATLETQNHQPVRVAAANCGILPGGCYGQSAYRPPIAQNVPGGYSMGTANCASGQCVANCPNGWCGPIGTARYTARPYSPVSYSQGTANCPNGQCPLQPGYTSRPATCYGPNCPQQGSGSYYPQAYQTRYNSVPGTWSPSSSYSLPRYNSYPVSRPVDYNWPSTYRTVPTSSFQNSNSPFFN